MAGIKTSGGGVFNTASVFEIQDAVNTALAARFTTSNEGVYRKIAFVDDGRSTGGTPVGDGVAGVPNGSDGKAGETVHYPLSPVSNASQKWPFGVPRAEVDAVVIDVTVERLRQGPPVERIYLDYQDPYQILSGKQAEIISRADLAPDYDLADTINSNPVCYDGKRFFDTAHPVSPTSGPTEVYSNDITCTQAEWNSGEGLAKLLDAFSAIPWFDGLVKDGAMAKPVIVTSTRSQAFKAGQLTAFINGQQGDESKINNGESSPFVGAVAGIYHFEQLKQPVKWPNSAQYVYAIASAGGAVQPAFIFSPKRMPHLVLYGMDETDEIRREFEAIGWSWSGFWGTGVGLPQCAVRMRIIP